MRQDVDGGEKGGPQILSAATAMIEALLARDQPIEKKGITWARQRWASRAKEKSLHPEIDRERDGCA
jgi:hypothetical protein